MNDTKNVNKAVQLQIGINSQIDKFGSADRHMAEELSELINCFAEDEDDLFIEMIKEHNLGPIALDIYKRGMWYSVETILPNESFHYKLVGISRIDGSVGEARWNDDLGGFVIDGLLQEDVIEWCVEGVGFDIWYK
jgi:hypothetical protein